MAGNYAQTIEDLQALVRQKEEDLAATKRTVNSLCKTIGMPPVYPDADQAVQAATVANIRRDQWYGQPLATAIREYLNMRRVSNLGPASINEIYDALKSGGYHFDTGVAENVKRNLRISMAKNTAVFHRLPADGSYGLAEWYPEAKVKDEPAKTKRRGRRASPELMKKKQLRLRLDDAASTTDSPKGKPIKRLMLSPEEIVDEIGDPIAKKQFKFIKTKSPVAPGA